MVISMHTSPDSVAPRAKADRLIGVRSGLPERPGPTTVLLAGLHGNEPAGVVALERVLADLDRKRIPIAGRIAGLRGNVAALAGAQRFLDSDLNRAFRYHMRADRTPLLTAPLNDAASEHAELIEILDGVRSLIDERDATREVFVIDLHTFSADGAPFVLFADTLRNRTFARCLPVPFLLGLAEQIQGTASDFFTAAGCVSVVFESGRHDDPRSIELFECAIRLMLARAGNVAPDAFDLDADRRALRDATRELPRFLDVQIRHALEPTHEFRMRQGYPNFAIVRAGEHLADDGARPVHAERAGRVLLPLNQRLGEEGYFIGREISGAWLAVSSLLRSLHLDALAPLLPGVSRHPTEPHTLRVNTHIARFVATDLFHLLGFRRRRVEDGVIVVSRRAHDLRRPDRILI